MTDEAMMRAATIRERLREDMVKTLRQNLGVSFVVTGTLLDELVQDAMFHVEHLLAEQES